MILQSDLARFLELKSKATETAGELELARKHLIRELPNGVESGRCSVKMEARESKRFSYDAMVDAIGRFQADRIKELLPIQTSNVLTVTSGP